MERLIGMMLQTVQNYNPPPSITNNSVPLWTHISDALQQSVYRVLSLFIAVLPGTSVAAAQATAARAGTDTWVIGEISRGPREVRFAR